MRKYKSTPATNSYVAGVAASLRKLREIISRHERYGNITLRPQRVLTCSPRATLLSSDESEQALKGICHTLYLEDQQ